MINYKNNTTTIILSLLLCCLNFVGAKAQSTDAELRLSLDSILSNYSHQPGVALGVLSDGKVFYTGGSGLANLEYDVLISEETIFESGAMAMHMTAYAILQLAEKGKLTLDDPISLHLKEVPNYERGIPTIRHLLHHSAGIRDYFEVHNMKGNSIFNVLDQSTAVSYIQKCDHLTITPGSDYRYSHSNYLLLALIIEEVSGSTYPEYMQANLFEPLGMSSSFIYSDRNRVIKNQAIGYAKEGDLYYNNHRYNVSVYGDGRIKTNVRDMMRWLGHLHQESQINGSKTRQLYVRGVIDDGTKISYALGLEHLKFRGTFDTYAHSGYSYGITSMIIAMPGKDLFIVGFSNNGSVSGGRVAYSAAEIMLSQVAKEGHTDNVGLNNDRTKSADHVALDEGTMQRYVAYYYNEALGYSREIFLDGEKLMFRDREDPDRDMIALSEGEFVLKGENKFISFQEELDGSIKMYYRNGGRPPVEFSPYIPGNLDKRRLKELFSGSFYSEEIDVTYRLEIVEEDKLLMNLGERKLDTYQLLSNNTFNSAHDGYVKFIESEDGTYDQFILNNYWVGSVSFVRSK